MARSKSARCFTPVWIRGRRKMRLLKWNSGGREQWFEASGVGETRGAMRMPVVGRMTSSFGMRRHPLLGYSRFHKGMDFGAAYGSPIVRRDRRRGRLRRLAWRSRQFREAQSCRRNRHWLWPYEPHLGPPGAHVSQGQVIGYVGSTGLSTGPHLHYEVYKNGVAINPMSIKFTTTAQLAGAELARFRATLNRLLAVHAGAAQSKTRTAEAGQGSDKKRG
jgi:hypothetical protein